MADKKPVVPMPLLNAARYLAPNEDAIRIFADMLVTAAGQDKFGAQKTAEPTALPLMMSFSIGGGQTLNSVENTSRAKELAQGATRTINYNSTVDFEGVCRWWVSTGRTPPEKALGLLSCEARAQIEQITKGADRSEATPAAALDKERRLGGLLIEAVTPYLPTLLLHPDGTLNAAQMAEKMLERLSERGEDAETWGFGKTTLRNYLARVSQTMPVVTPSGAKRVA